MQILVISDNIPTSMRLCQEPAFILVSAELFTVSFYCEACIVDKFCTNIFIV